MTGLSKEELIRAIGTPKQIEEFNKRNEAILLSKNEAKQKEIEYAKSLYNPAPTVKKVRKIDFSQEISYEEACIIFREIRIKRGEFITERINPNFKWMLNSVDKEMIANLIKYFINDSSSSFPLHKGIWLFSKPGVGKSEIMYLLSLFCTKANLTKSFGFINISEEYTKARNDKNCDNITKLVQGNKCLDEFLFQFGDVNSYGNKIDLNEAIVEQRYNRMTRFCQFTHLTSNVSPSEAVLEKKINPRIADRLNAMCTAVLWEGESKRG